VEIDDLIMYL